MEIKHIYWFSYFNLDEPSVRYRAKYPLEYLNEKHDITSSFIYPGYSFQNIFKFIGIYFSVLFFRKRNSVIVFQKIYTKGVYATALKLLLFLRAKDTLYDIDDAEYTRQPIENIHHFMKMCSCISVGSEALREYASRFNSHVFFLTSPVIKHKYVKQTLEDVFTIGWIGYYNAHRESLNELFFPASIILIFLLSSNC